MRLVQLATLTLTLGIFAATVAGVEASNVSDHYLYQAGGPLRLHETFDRQHAPPAMRGEPDIMPVAARLALPGVLAASCAWAKASTRWLKYLGGTRGPSRRLSVRGLP